MQIKLLEPDLRLVIESLSVHLSEVTNEIVTCPNPEYFALDVQKLQLKQSRLTFLKHKLESQL